LVDRIARKTRARHIKDMTPQIAASLTLHEPEVAGIATSGEGLLRTPRMLRPAPLREARPELDDACLPALWRREALHRRLLGLFDVVAAGLVLLVVGLAGGEGAAMVAIAATPLLALLFKLAGLYDRDELRLVHSTLDEAPLLLQLTGLFTLCVAIAQSAVAGASL
jgi:hypothetical protein